MAEIRALRGQLEQSIQVNNRLRLQLEQQMDHGASKASISPSPVDQSFSAMVEPANPQPLFQGREKEGSQSSLLWDVRGTGDSLADEPIHEGQAESGDVLESLE